MMVQSAFFEAGSVLASLVRLLSQEKMAVSRQAEPRVEIFYFPPPSHGAALKKAEGKK